MPLVKLNVKILRSFLFFLSVLNARGEDTYHEGAATLIQN